MARQVDRVDAKARAERRGERCEHAAVQAPAVQQRDVGSLPDALAIEAQRGLPDAARAPAATGNGRIAITIKTVPQGGIGSGRPAGMMQQQPARDEAMSRALARNPVSV
jgi:hypothetical protein